MNTFCESAMDPSASVASEASLLITENIISLAKSSICLEIDAKG